MKILNDKSLGYSQKHRLKIWRRIASVVLCVALLSTNMVSALAAEMPENESAFIEEENGESAGAVLSDSSEESVMPTDQDVSWEDTDTSEESSMPVDEDMSWEDTGDSEEASAPTDTDAVYTFYLTHVFRFTADGKGRNVSATETLELTEADFQDGVCDLFRFVYDAEQLTVTEANPLSIEDFDENRRGGARIVYAVNSGWKIVRKEDATGEGSVLREVFNGKLGDYEFVPADVVRINVGYKYSNTGGLAGIDAASPDTVEAIPEKQADGTYKVTWDLPSVEGFRIVLDPSELNKYVVNPPTGNETAAELEAALERGDFNVDIDNHTIYYYQEANDPDHTVQHPIYSNRYSTEYNQAWNSARILTTDGYTATAAGDNNNHGANALVNPKLEVSLTETQLTKALNGGTDLDITVYYRRNATWYTVNHWVPKTLAGTLTGSEEEKNENGVVYVRLDQETLQGRVGAMTRAAAKTDGDTYEKVESVDFSQKLIENADTVVDIYYKAADSYRVIFDTDYTYIPRQQVAMGGNVDFTKVNEPTWTGYTFAGWRYLKKDATLNDNGEYADTDYTDVGKDAVGSYMLTINNELIGKAKLEESGGVLALHLYPKWEPAQTQVRVILWTEDLTGMDDVQAIATGGNSGEGSYYTNKYANYSAAPVTHNPQLGTSDPYYSNMGSFTVDVTTDSSLVETGNTNLLDSIQKQVTAKFKETMGKASSIDVDNFYTQAAFEIVHEEEGGTNYHATTASADGKTMIYVYFTRNIYELQFHFYGQAEGSEFSVAIQTNGYSFSHGAAVPNGVLNFAYSASHDGYHNAWRQANVTQASEMPVPEIITIKAKYGADLREVWPVSQGESITNLRGEPARLVSWGTTAGKYCEDSYPDASGSTHTSEPTIMGIYAGMGSEIIADPSNREMVHHLVAFWTGRTDGNICYYRYNHCYEVPELNVTDSMQKVSIYDNDATDARNFLYLVPTDNSDITKYEFNDLMTVSYVNGQITYDDINGTYYAVRAYNGKYYALSRQVVAPSTNAINKQNPSARLHMTRANQNADHSTQYADDEGGYPSGPWFTNPNNPYDLYFYYDRDRYTITYMAPSNNITTANEVTLGTIELPYGAQVTQEKYGFKLNYTDKNTNAAYGWTPAAETAVCPDRAENGTAEWKFKGWGLGPADVNMQWTVDENTETQGQAGEAFAIQGNLRLYAIWEAPAYTVTFHLNGGMVNNAGTSIEEEIPANTRYSANGIIPRPLRDSYTLDGWYVADENGNITQPETAFDFDQTIAANKHVAAKWSAVSTQTFDYTIYYVTDKPLDADKTRDKVQIDASGNIGASGTTYYVLGKVEHTNQMFIANSSLNFSATVKNGYVPQETNKILTLNQPADIYNVIFYYDPITPGKYVVNFVEAGTEKSDNPTLVKTLTVKADQTVVTPKSAVATDLVKMGYALVNKDGDQYTAIDKAEDLKWIDANGDPQSTATLKGNAIPDTITYLVQPISYTITYQNATGSPVAADTALNAVTAEIDTPVANAGDKNPTQYTTKDNFTAKNPARVYENGKWYQFSYWSLGADTTETENKTTFSTLKVEPGTVGNLIFVANWEEMTDVGSLTVTKTVGGDAGDQTKDFNFTVTLSDTSINGTISEMEFTNGVANFTLKHNERKTTGLPAGITYNVAETEANQDGYTTTSVGESGTIMAEGTTAALTNTKNEAPPEPGTGNMTVSKVVEGTAGETSRDSNFTLRLTDADGNAVNGTIGEMEFTDGAAIFTLKHGESKTITGIPIDTKYDVVEAEANADGYVTTSVGTAGTITAEGVTAAFTNTRNAAPPEPGTGNLTVSKVVEGTAGDQTKDFTFTVTLNDTSLSGTFGDMIFTNGVATFTLKHGESRTAVGIPSGTTYTVTEAEANQDGYVTKADGAEGTIVSETTITALFNNHKDGNTNDNPGGNTNNNTNGDSNGNTNGNTNGGNSTRPDSSGNAPKTGDEMNLALWLMLMGVSCAGAVLTLVFSRRRGKNQNITNK